MKKEKKRLIAWLPIVLAIASLMTVVAFAAHPHFIGAPVFTTSGGTLTSCAKIAGLGNEDVTITLTATGTTTCTNRGGNVPPGQTQTVSGTISNLRPENGTVSFCVTTASVSNPCPDRMTPTTTFTDATLTIFQGGNIVLKQSFTP